MLAQHVAQVLTCMAAKSDHRAEVRNIPNIKKGFQFFGLWCILGFPTLRHKAHINIVCSCLFKVQKSCDLVSFSSNLNIIASKQLAPRAFGNPSHLHTSWPSNWLTIQGITAMFPKYARIVGCLVSNLTSPLEFGLFMAFFRFTTTPRQFIEIPSTPESLAWRKTSQDLPG